MGFVSILRHLMKDPGIGKLIVPIVPDEGRTFGLESAIKQVGIYASEGQKYKPHDVDMVLSYREEKDGQILEEGITEAGAMASFTAAGTAYANYKVATIPFYMYYSMFGFQRVGDMMWAFADARGKGFLMAGTAGRTTMMGEGLQHQDGHSHLLMSVIPTCLSYDPAYVYEMAVILQDGMRRMYEKGEDVFYYITMYNEDYAMPEMPEGAREGIVRGIYRLKPAPGGKAVAQLFGSGPILNEVLRAQEILAEKYGVQTDVWSVTSYNELRREALGVERWNRLHPARAGEDAVHCVGAEQGEGADYRGDGLHEGGAGSACSVADDAAGVAGDGWIRAQRQSRASAAAFRSECGVGGGGDTVEAGARGKVRREEGAEGAGRAGRGCGAGRPGAHVGRVRLEANAGWSFVIMTGARWRRSHA